MVGVLLPRNLPAAAYSVLTLAFAGMAMMCLSATPGGVMKLYQGFYGKQLDALLCFCGVFAAQLYLDGGTRLRVRGFQSRGVGERGGSLTVSPGGVMKLYQGFHSEQGGMVPRACLT
jgi:hypothetical protein